MTTQTTRRLSASIAVALSILLFTAVPASAQTLADAARRERERKKTAHHLHVYTNEDLAKPRILVPGDEARAGRMGSDPAEAVSVAPGPVIDSATGTAADAAVLRASTPAAVSPKDRKEAASNVIAGTPNVQVIDSYSGSGPMVMPPELAATKPSFPADPNGAGPLFTPKGQVALPTVNLPQVTLDAYPLFDVFAAPSTINFPGAAEGLPTSVRAPFLDRAPAAPVVSDAAKLPPAIGAAASHPLLAIPSEPAAVTPRPAAAIESEAPAMPALAAPIGIPPAGAPLDIPVAPAPRADNPIQLPARTLESSTVTVRRGDSLWKLAARFLGDGQRWRELAKINPQVADPSLIHPGDPIHLPTLPTSAARRGDLKSMVVRRGDTLWRVARAEFGQSPALNCIAKANQLPSVDLIRVGQTLVLPAECGLSK